MESKAVSCGMATSTQLSVKACFSNCPVIHADWTEGIPSFGAGGAGGAGGGGGGRRPRLAGGAWGITPYLGIRASA